jgi:hypothetical protein
MEIQERLETAIAAYLAAFVDGDLTTLNPGDQAPATWFWPASLKNSAGQLRIFSGESDQTKDGQAILCISEDANQEEPQFTGNLHIPIQIWLRTPVKVLTAAEVAAKQPTSLTNHSAAAAILSDALNQDPFALAGAINAAGTNFTIMGGVMDLKPMRQEQDNFFASGWSFRVYAMGLVAA